MYCCAGTAPRLPLGFVSCMEISTAATSFRYFWRRNLRYTHGRHQHYVEPPSTSTPAGTSFVQRQGASDAQDSSRRNF